MRLFFPLVLFLTVAHYITPYVISGTAKASHDVSRDRMLTGVIELIELELTTEQSNIDKQILLDRLSLKYHLPLSLKSHENSDSSALFLPEQTVKYNAVERLISKRINTTEEVIIGPLQEGRPAMRFELDFILSPMINMMADLLRSSTNPKYQVKQLQQSFGFPVQVVPLNDLPHLTAPKQQMLLAGQNTNLYNAEIGLVGNEMLNLHTATCINTDCSDVLLLGPFYQPDNKKVDPRTWKVSYFASFFIIFVIFWNFPQFLAHRKFLKTADEFTSGNLNARVKVNSFSLLKIIEPVYNKMATRLQRLIRDHKMLSYNISHESRNALSRITYSIEILLLEKEVSDNLNSATYRNTQQKLLNNIDNELTELAALSTTLEQYSGLTNNAITLNVTSISINQYLTTLTEKYALLYPLNDIKLITNNEASSITIDAQWMNRALGNILENAVRYARHITIRWKVDHDTTAIMVDDDGQGVSEKLNDDVFSPFVTSNEETSTANGLGLGLTITQQVVELHAGNIEMKRSALGGCKFTVILPNDKVAR